MRLKWYGTATILLEQDGTQLLFDPFFPLNKSIFQPSISELSAVQNIMVTHGHLDHVVHIPAIWEESKGKITVYCTAKPRETLISKGINSETIHKIALGEVLTFGAFEVNVLKGRHIDFDMWMVIKTLLNPRIIYNWRNALYLLRENKECSEGGETVVYDIKASGKRILLLGSLNLDESTEYPKNVDLLVIPFQGRSDIGKYAMAFVDRLQPRKVLLNHFDDSFPPISSFVKIEPFIFGMQRKHPNIPVVCPQAGGGWVEV